MKVVAINTIMEMSEPSLAKLSFPEISGLSIEPAQPEDAEAYRQLYHDVGRGHLWLSRTRWTTEDYKNRIEDKTIYVWLARIHEEPVGFAEIGKIEDGTVQIFFLGVSPRHEGEGIGKHLLSFAVREAWKLNPRMLWLLTRNYDGEYALQNYRKRGFGVTKVRPELLGVSKEYEAEAREVLKIARERNLHPRWRQIVLAYLRDTWPGELARNAVYWWRMRKLKRKLHDQKSEIQ